MRNFRPGLALTAQAGFALVTVLALAYWQYSRGVEKSALAEARDEMLALAPREIRVDTDTVDFSRVATSGRYDRERSFFARAIRSGRPGFDVYTRFETYAGSFIVHRGWVPASSRDGLPAVDTPLGEVEITGVVWPTAEVPPVQRQADWGERWPKRIGVVDVERMAQSADTGAREFASTIRRRVCWHRRRSITISRRAPTGAIWCSGSRSAWQSSSVTS